MITQKRDCIKCNRITTHDYLKRTDSEEFGEPILRGLFALTTLGVSEIARQAIVTRGWRCQRCRRTVWNDK